MRRFGRISVFKNDAILDVGWWTRRRGYLIWRIRPNLCRPAFQYGPARGYDQAEDRIYDLHGLPVTIRVWNPEDR